MKMDVRKIESDQATELYLTLTPTDSASVDQGREIFEAAAGILRQENARICQERVFASPHDLADLRKIRSQAYGELNDAIEPVWLAAENGTHDGLLGVQIHAVCVPTGPRILSVDDVRARLFELDGCRWLAASGLCAPEAGDADAQARASFEKAERLLKQADADLGAVARTWIFMDDILSWYDRFNQVRNTFFRERGILGPIADGRVPASTGIGVSPVGGARCAIDLFAVIGPEGSVQRYGAAGQQRSPYEYGAAFARAAMARTPAGRAIFISGTAAIDAAGATCCRNDGLGQIRMTIENVEAVLLQLGASPNDVVHAIAYCANPEVREAFVRHCRDELPWPWLTTIGDVCRPDLLFEVEATACLPARP